MASSTNDRRSGGLTGPLTLVWLLTVGVAVLAIDARATYGARTTADEPQYLLTALSLAEDFDLDISDELAEQRFRSFHELDLNSQTIDLNDQGQRLSPHDPLLAVLLAPAVAVGGWVGAKLLLAVVAGFTAVVTTWTAVRRLGVGARAASVVTTAFFVAPPLTSYATQVYPEMMAALATVAGVSALLGLSAAGPRPDQLEQHRSGARLRLELVAVLAVVALPWLAVKYVPVASVLAAALVGIELTHGERRRAAVQTMVLIGAGISYLAIHQRIYGGWTVYAAGDHFTNGEFEVVGTDPNYLGRSRRLLGLLLDRRFGLVPWNPAYLVLPAAVAVLLRARGLGRVEQKLPVGVLVAGWSVATWVALTMHGWWWPGRQLVVVLPMAVLATTVLCTHVRGATPAVATMGAVGGFTWLWLVVESSTGRRTLIVDFFETSAPPYRLLSFLFPDHARHASADQLVTALWLGALVASAVAATRWARSGIAVDGPKIPSDRNSDQPTAATPDSSSPDALASPTTR